MYAKIRDTTIYFDVEGLGLIPYGNTMKEKPTAFLIHGGPGADHSSYKPLFSNLTDQLQLVYFDHRGQGRSARGNKDSYTLENNVEDMEALREYLGLEKIVLIGGSYGGMVALSYGIKYPEKVQGLIAMATAGSYHFLARAKEILHQKGTLDQIAIAEYLWQGNFRDENHLRKYFQVMASLYSLTYNPNISTNSFKRVILSVDAINIAFGKFLREYNVINDLQKITAPSLIIGAKEDWICAPEFSEEIAQYIPNSTLKILDNCGHLIRADQPKQLMIEIRNFIDQNIL
jgi:proline iminopeptidase